VTGTPCSAGGSSQSLDENAVARSLLDQLLTDSRLYTQSKDYKDLLEFVVRLRNFAPFNAMLLHLQKPGLSYAASAADWRERFGRTPKNGARPLLILWPFGPVALVYDVLDTEGTPLPEDTATFFARGPIDEAQIQTFKSMTTKKDIQWTWLDAGDQRAGSIGAVKWDMKTKEPTLYELEVNRHHAPPVQLATLAHELGHLYLGHLGQDSERNIPARPFMNRTQREIEAESVAYLVCARNGVGCKSETYLSNYVCKNTTIEHLDIYQIMRAAGQVEGLLGLTAHTKFEKPKSTIGEIGAGQQPLL
jgi:hypothetical protein